jgi:hypothetical protein
LIFLSVISEEDSSAFRFRTAAFLVACDFVVLVAIPDSVCTTSSVVAMVSTTFFFAAFVAVFTISFFAAFVAILLVSFLTATDAAFCPLSF